MTTLKQLQEKVEFTNECIFEKPTLTIDANTNILSVNLNEYIKQIEASAYNAGKEEMIDKVIFKIKEKGLHLGYANNIIDEFHGLKNKLLDNKVAQD